MWKLAGKWARRAGVSIRTFHHELQVRTFLAFSTWEPRKGKLTTWTAWQARATASRLRREHRGPPRMKVASQSERLTGKLDNAGKRLRYTPEDEEEFPVEIDPDELRELVGRLRPRVAEAMRLRFGLGGDGEGMTLEEAGKVMEVSKERVRQLINRGLAELREELVGA
jgi:RNA polymerase sigma factor (sigma-70 family)